MVSSVSRCSLTSRAASRMAWLSWFTSSMVVVAGREATLGSRAMLRAEADEVVCLYEPDPFLAVGLYYQDFVPTGDAEIQRMLADARERVHAPPAAGAATSPDKASG